MQIGSYICKHTINIMDVLQSKITRSKWSSLKGHIIALESCYFAFYDSNSVQP